ncbi:MAG: T9SS sorting signal type C domain-containing protein, partial [Bacteroidia bacterium]
GANTHMTVTGEITVAGTLNVLNNGSLVQIDDAAVNTGNISYERSVSIRMNDYVFWSSPITNFNVNAISPLTPSANILKWNPTIANANSGLGNWVAAANEIMIPATGYIVRGPDNFTSTAQNFTANFVNGIPNNGVITTAISRGNFTGGSYNGTNGAQITRFDDNWNLVGNPYPSAIRALDFLNLNTNIEGAIRLWTHTNLPSSAISSPFYGTTQSNYTPADYITYNGLGTVSGPAGFNGFIAGGQGFFVQMNDGATATQNITFNNSLRSATYTNNQFYRNAQVEENSDLVASRIWLDIIDSANNSDRTLLGYTEGATAEKDRLFDAVTAAGLSMKIYSLLDNDMMTIQGKSYPLDVNDKVNLGVNISSNGNYSIAIAALDGVASDLPIYLEDKQLNLIHNLRQSPYSFTATIGQSNDRFVLRYNNETLGNNDFVLDNEVMVISNNTIQVISNTTLIRNVRIYNVLGQLLLDSNAVSVTTFETSKIQKSNTALFVQVTLENGAKVTKKIVF